MKQVQGINTKREKGSSKWETGSQRILAGYLRAEEGSCKNFQKRRWEKVGQVILNLAHANLFKVFLKVTCCRQCISGACKDRTLAATDQGVSSTQINLCELIVRGLTSSKRNTILSFTCFHYMSDRTIMLILFFYWSISTQWAKHKKTLE